MRIGHWVLIIAVIIVAWWAYQKYGKGVVASATA